MTPLEKARKLLRKLDNSEIITLSPRLGERGFDGRLDQDEADLIRDVAMYVIQREQGKEIRRLEEELGFDTVVGAAGIFGLQPSHGEQKTEAIKTIEECKKIHDDWASYQDDTPDWEKKSSTSSLGDADHHRKWSRKYDQVLKVLRARKD